MTNPIRAVCKRLFSSHGTLDRSPEHQPVVANDIREEYAKAFRTESYFDFWSRIIGKTNHASTTCNDVVVKSSSNSGARLPSYRLFAEHLLEPDQPTITALVNRTQPLFETKPLLIDYFSETAKASLLCGRLLKDIDLIRAKHRTLKKIIESHQCRRQQITNPPFLPLARFDDVQGRCAELLKRLESNRGKVHGRLRIVKHLRRGCGAIVVVLTISLTLVVVTHALVVFVGFPAFFVGSLETTSVKRLARADAQLDAASKGAYILTRDLDTIGRLVVRVNDEMEHIGAKVGLVVELREVDRIKAKGEVVRQLRNNEMKFREQLDELEEHLYLCIMTINRARNLVAKEIFDKTPS